MLQGHYYSQAVIDRESAQSNEQWLVNTQLEKVWNKLHADLTSLDICLQNKKTTKVTD
jgi:hypothetical protein